VELALGLNRRRGPPLCHPGGRGAVITAIYAFWVTWFLLKFVNLFVPVRVSPEFELLGLDETVHGEIA
jgi:ammonia channel protein AmtB